MMEEKTPQDKDRAMLVRGWRHAARVGLDVGAALPLPHSSRPSEIRK